MVKTIRIAQKFMIYHYQYVTLNDSLKGYFMKRPKTIFLPNSNYSNLMAEEENSRKSTVMYKPETRLKRKR